MKLIIKQDENAEETEIIIVCRYLDSEIEEIISSISFADNTVTGKREGETYFIPIKEILYFESVDSKTFFYTDNFVYETTLRLYQIEEKLKNTVFARISKSVIANLKKMRSIKPEKNNRLCAVLTNGERLLVSRQYISVIKGKLGVK